MYVCVSTHASHRNDQDIRANKIRKQMEMGCPQTFYTCVHKNEMMFHLLSIIFFYVYNKNIIGVLCDCIDVVDGRTRMKAGKCFCLLVGAVFR